MRGDEQTFRLEDDGLVRTDASGKQVLPYKDITQINLLTYVADMVDPEDVHGQLTLRRVSGANIKIRSHHLKSLGSYENRAKTYALFVRDLCGRVSDANPDAKFLTGGTAMRTVWLVMAVLIGLVGAVLILGAIFDPWRFDIGLGGAVALFIAWTAWRQAKQNAPEPFDPIDLPSGLIDLE